MGAEPSILSPWASVFCFWVVPCNPVSEDILECFSCSKSPRCCCFELLGDMALRLDTGHFWLLVSGQGGVLSILRCLNILMGEVKTQEWAEGASEWHASPSHHP